MPPGKCCLWGVFPHILHDPVEGLSVKNLIQIADKVQPVTRLQAQQGGLRFPLPPSIPASRPRFADTAENRFSGA